MKKGGNIVSKDIEVKIGKIEQHLIDIKDNQEKGFDAVNKRLDVSNGRVNKLEICNTELVTNVGTIFKSFDLRRDEWEEKYVTKEEFQKNVGVLRVVDKELTTRQLIMYGIIVFVLIAIINITTGIFSTKLRLLMFGG